MPLEPDWFTNNMDVITSNILTIITFTPAAGAVLLLFYNREHIRSIRVFALIVTILTFVFSLHLAAHFDSNNPDFQFGLKVPWIPSFGIDYSMGVDGISLFLILLTTLLSPLAILASWSIHERLKEYFVFMLLLETGMIGVFVSLDLFLFYVFWEIMLVPMYFLIGVWGGERRVYAAIKFVLYTMAGSELSRDFRMCRRNRRIDEVERQNSQQQQNRSDQRVEEEFDGRVEFPRAAPDADQEVHRHEHDFPEHIKEEEVERDENAEHAGLQHQHEDVILFHAVLDGVPRRERCEGTEQRRQQDEEQRDAVDTDVEVSAERLDPIVVLDELHLI